MIRTPTAARAWHAGPHGRALFRRPGRLARRALLLLTAAGLGGERLLALDREQIRFTAHGVTFALPGDGDPAQTAKPPPVAAGDVPEIAGALVIARRSVAAACPVRALEHWLHSSDTQFGSVFRKVDRWGSVEHRRMRLDALRRIWLRRAKPLRAARRTEADGA